MSLLWPEATTGNARNLLNAAVHSIRRALGEGALLTQGGGIVLDTAQVRIDVLEFEGALDSGNPAHAVERYSGPLLDGLGLPDAVEFERWHETERQRLEELYRNALERVAMAVGRDHGPSAAVQWWRRRVACTPLDARVTMRLMETLTAAGDRGEALRAAATHAQLMEAELGVAPDSGVQELAEWLRSNVVCGSPRAGREADTPSAAVGTGHLEEEQGSREEPGLSPAATAREGFVQPSASAPAQAVDQFASITGVVPSRDSSPSAYPDERKPGSSRWVRAILGAALALGLASLALWTARLTPGGFEGPRATSIAVLPFANMSPDEADDYFSDGVTEEIMTALSKVEGLRVAARTSAFAFKGKSEGVSEIGRQLRVNTVLEGAVRRAGDRLRINAQLINVEDGYQLWADSYDRDLRDIFAVQGEIAHAIVGALRMKLSTDATALAARPTTDLTAYDLYLKGRHALNQRSGGPLVQAVAYFEQAIARDSLFAHAYAGLADAYVLLPGYGVATSLASWPKGRAAAERALALDSTLAEAHTSLAYGKFLFDWDWHAAEQGFRKAIALNPDYATAHHWYGDFLGGRGDLEGYLRELRQAHALDPLSGQIGTEVGRALFALRRYDEAVTHLQNLLRTDPAFAGAHVTLGRVYIQQDRLTEAIAAIQKAVQLRGRNALDVAYLASAYALAGRNGEAQRLLLELEGRTRREHVPPTVLAIVHTGLGQYESAFDWLDRAVAERDGWLPEFVFLPTFDPLRTHPRYATLLQALGLN